MKENRDFVKGVLLVFRTCYFHNDVLFSFHDEKLFEIIGCRSAEILSVVRQRKYLVEPSSHYRALKQIELISRVESTTPGIRGLFTLMLSEIATIHL